MSPTRILVVEDEAIVAKDIQAALEILGYAVPAIAASGEAAIEKAELLRPDLVLMDIRLKGQIDGVKAAQEIGGRLGIPIVYLTAYADEPTLRRAKVTQPLGYIVKPFDEKDLHAAIELALHRHRAQMTLRSLALVDDLTGLYNRRGFLSLARQQIKFARRTKQGFWLIYLDVDRLKHINDAFGHQEGDRALNAIADILRQTFRESDVIARLGGDEFVVLAIQAAANGPLTQRLQENLDRRNAEATRAYELALSIGAVRFDPESAGTLEGLMMKADEALYEHKRSKQLSRRGALGTGAPSPPAGRRGGGARRRRAGPPRARRRPRP